MANSRSRAMLPPSLDDELSSFREMEKETLKLDRSILQQNGAISRLKLAEEKLEKKREKELSKSTHIDAQLKSCLHANKSIKENLKGKRRTRIMMEEMVTNLERQLQLEQIDVMNKVQGFELTQKKYEEIWKNYETIYSRLPHVMKKVKAEEELKEANDLLNKKRADMALVKDKILETSKLGQERLVKSALLIAKHLLAQKLEQRLDHLKEVREKVHTDVKYLEMELRNAQSKEAIVVIQQTKRKSKLRDLMNSLLEKEDALTMEVGAIPLDTVNSPKPQMELFDTTISSTPFELDSLEEEETFYQNYERDYPPAKRTKPSSPVATTPAIADVDMVCPEHEVISETEAENMQAIPHEPENGLNQIADDEPVVEIESNLLPTALTQQASSERIESVEPMEKNIPETEASVDETEVEDVDCSQTTVAPADLRAEQQQALISMFNEQLASGMSAEQAHAVMEELMDAAGEEWTGDTLSQGTESTTGSLANLLDDEKRQEFMRRLMATATMSIPPQDINDTLDNTPSSPRSQVYADPDYMQRFYALMNSGNEEIMPMASDDLGQNSEQFATPASSITSEQQTSQRDSAAASNHESIAGADNFLGPAGKNPTAAAGFAGFGGFFGASSAAPASRSFFADAFGDAPSGTDQAEQRPSFNYGFGIAPSSNSSSSFMNMF